ncbi:hypothetical protein FNAPI_11622 [Fusarium napiforme]|uniref:Uncharacterized protein n=1 Tax=Fusarium napiforme TaxID=42672 RepID=A0A8H5IGJ0_9HYPO|nr:hypothetical protein FNAPI_11622 [Fusarium napiforme]
MASKYTLLLPVKLDAFVFNGEVCDGVGAHSAKIAPITQPNYTFLQLEDHLAQNDILDHVDLHAAAPKEKNQRYVDIGKVIDGKVAVRQNRVGVYVHWSLPRPLRSGIANTEGGGTLQNQDLDPRAPKYPPIPNRWLVIRRFDPKAETTSPINPNGMEPVTAWVIESDKTSRIDELPASTDLEVDVAPFVTSYNSNKDAPGEISIEDQAEVFIGACVEASKWDPKDKPNKDGERVELTAASSSNQLFMDCQYHCGNVFSMLDTFAYKDTDGATKHLDSVVADYYVVGWHNDSDKDIMASSKDGASHATRLQALRASIKQAIPEADKDAINLWLQDTDGARTLCHGAMYEVVWNLNKSPEKNPANALAQTMSKMPFGVGTTPMDAILAYIGERDRTGDVEKRIWCLQTLLRAVDDGVDSQIAADDEAQAYNYAHFDGGDHFYLPDEKGGKDKDASAYGTPEDLRIKNSAQHLLDSAKRRLKQLRWDVFSWWWKLISDVDNNKNGNQDTRSIHDIQDEVERLLKTVQMLEIFVGEPQTPIKRGVMEAFHQRNDPTLIIGGVEAGWPTDFNKELAARLENQTIDADPLPSCADKYVDCLASDVQAAGRRLLQEFFSLKKPDATQDDRVKPLYHDGKRPGDKVDKDNNPWRDRWGGSQAWFPLYVEWEAEYAHVSFKHWQLNQRRPLDNAKGKTTYVIKDDIRMEKNCEKYDDLRYVSGRSLILPQPAFSLRVHIERLFATVPESELNKKLKPKDREILLEKLDGLALLSLPLSGLTDHLTTRFQGSHIKPLVRAPGQKPVVLKGAKDALPPPDSGRSDIDLSLIEENSDPTPYGSLPTLTGQYVSGFKPVTHGQMRFTKINIVDKFGQVVHAMDPALDQPPAVLPSISEFFAIDEVPGKPGVPNVVCGDRSTLKKPEYVQLPPSINQTARLNASFVVRSEDKDGSEGEWRPATEFDKPIWGWVVVNYVDRGLQFFLPNGTFYREVRSASSSIKWLPFGEPPNPGTRKQLDALIDSLVGNEKRLRAFTDMIMSALSVTVPTPSAYSQFMNSLVGRPLALANMGWSLELGTNSLKNESTLGEQRVKPEWGLLPGDGNNRYEFAIKFGDEKNNYDGLVGYFETTGNEKDLNLNKIYTYFHTKYDLDDAPLAKIDTKSYPHLQTFWLNPDKYKPGTVAEVEAKAREYERDRNKEMTVFGAIFDPFAPITGFSSILPMRKLLLPSWTWETALKAITTFFHAGPLVLTENVPKFNKEFVLKPETYEVGKTLPDAQVRVPALRAADWAWLQPYDQKSTLLSETHKYMSLNLAGDMDEAPRWTKGPLTAVEGFMQLKAPIEQGKVKEGEESP